MKIKLVFADWQNSEFDSIYNAPQGIPLTIGDFHSGSKFDAIIELDEEQHDELKTALRKGFIPFITIRDVGSNAT